MRFRAHEAAATPPGWPSLCALSRAGVQTLLASWAHQKASLAPVLGNFTSWVAGGDWRSPWVISECHRSLRGLVTVGLGPSPPATNSLGLMLCKASPSETHGPECSTYPLGVCRRDELKGACP